MPREVLLRQLKRWQFHLILIRILTHDPGAVPGKIKNKMKITNKRGVPSFLLPD